MFAKRENVYRRQAEERTQEAEWQQYVSDMHSAMAAWEQSNVGRTLELLERHRPLPGQTDLRGFEWHYLWRQCQDNRLKVTINESSFVRGVAFSHDGRMLATGNLQGVHLWNSTNGSLTQEFLVHPTAVSRVAFSPDDRILASSDTNGMIRLFEMADTVKFRAWAAHTEQILGLLFSPDGAQLASGGADETVHIWDVSTGCKLKTIHPSLHRSTPLMPIPPWMNKQLWAFGWDVALRLFDTETGMELRTIERKELTSFRSVAAVSWNGQLGATGGRDGVVRLFETKTGRDLESLGSHGAAVRAIGFAPGDETLVSSDAQGKVILWNLAKRSLRAVLRGHASPVWPLTFSDDGRRLCTSGGDQKLQIWDVTQQLAATDVCEGHGWLVLCVAFSPDGRLIASGGGEARGGLVMIWDVATGTLQQQFAGHTDWVLSVAFSPNGAEVASTGDDGTIRLWNVARNGPDITIDAAKDGTRGNHDTSLTSDGVRVRQLARHSSDGNAKSWVSYSHDGCQLISSDAGSGILRIWDRSTRKEIRSVQIGQSGLWEPAQSLDGRYLVAGVDESIVLLEYPSLKAMRRFPKSALYRNIVALDCNGKVIACCNNSNDVTLLSLDGAMLGTLHHTGIVRTVDVSPDGITLVTGDMNHEVHLWDVARRSHRATLHGHDTWVSMVRFSPDGKTIASSSNDGSIRLWRSEPPD
jgi:WD40 repeat protein